MKNANTAQLLDRVPPQNLDAEQATLGSMMLERSALDKGLEVLTSDDFYRLNHQEIYDALLAISRNDKPVDLITLQDELRDRGRLEDCGGVAYLMTLVEAVPTAANIEYYAGIVSEKSILRRLIGVGSEFVAQAHGWDGDIADLLAWAETRVFELAERRSGSGIIQMKTAYSNIYDTLERLREEGGRHGVPIGLKPLSAQCIAMFPGQLTVLGARPRIGKTALAWQLLGHAARQGYPAAIVSTEMSDEDFAFRDLARETGLHTRRLLMGQIEDHHWESIGAAVNRCFELPLYYVDAADWKMERIAGACRRLVSQGVKVVAIDHIQRVKPDDPRASRAVQVGQIARACKSLARQLGIPVIALCQFSRDIEKRGEDARPQLSDLKESGDVEAEADVVWLLWRPLSTTQTQMEVTPAEIIIAKQRMLQEGVAKCGFLGRKFEFVDQEVHHEDPRPRTRRNPPPPKQDAEEE